jgi:hypothetical protein
VLTASATDPDAGAVLRYDFELWAGQADRPGRVAAGHQIVP